MSRGRSVNSAYYEARQHPLFDDWWRVRALDEIVDCVVIPTLIIQAWQDEWIQPNGAIRLFKTLRSNQKRIILQNGPHHLSAYRCNQREQIRWLDRWVKGERNGVESEQPVKVLWEVVEPTISEDASPNWMTSYPTWPVPDLRWQSLYLTGEGELRGQDEITADGGERQFVYPFDALRYRTAPSKSDMAILGAPKLQFSFSADHSDMAFMFVLNDIDPSGNSLFLQRTVLRASLRGIDRARSGAEEILLSFAKVQSLVPGEVAGISLSLTALGHVVREGHQLELVIAAPIMTNLVWGFSPELPAVIATIYHSDRYASILQLPLVPNERALKPAPPLGVLRNQPCSFSAK
jgi:predicted acyl esterase